MTITPTIHLNGTSKTELLDQQLKALEALRKAGAALMRAAPNGRDYYPQGPQAYTEAATDHTARLKRIEVTIKELTDIASAISDSC